MVLELRLPSLPEAAIDVSRVIGWEALSQPYQFDIEFCLRTGEALSIADLCGAEACLTLRRPDGVERFVHGLIQTAQLRGLLGSAPLYRLTLVPALERLRQVKRNRAFQSTTIPDLVMRLLAQSAIARRSDLEGTYPTRDYCVQHQETDLAFVSRLLEETGIVYAFEHHADRHVLVLSDAAPNTAHWPTIHYRADRTVADTEAEDAIVRWRAFNELAVNRVAIGDFDFTRPDLALAATQATSAESTLEHYEHPAGFRDRAAGTELARRRLQEQQQRAQRFASESTCLGFQPGGGFALAGHPDFDEQTKCLLVSVRHEARQQRGSGTTGRVEHGYRNWAWAIPAEANYRPPRRTPRPRAQPTTATVSGDEEINVDGLARIQVKFHWAREQDEDTSCWLRCAQSLAGPGWGATFLPRRGQEVLVKFLEGDPDRPLIMGALYNSANSPPVALPDGKTASTLLSDSSPSGGGGGANELRFEDQAGGEVLLLHAQKEESIAVEHDKLQHVGAHELLRVAQDRSLSIRSNQALKVALDEVCAITATQEVSIGGALIGQVAGDSSAQLAQRETMHIAGAKTLAVKSAMFETHEASAALAIGGVLAINVAQALISAVGGNATLEVGAKRVEQVKGNRDEEVAQASKLLVGGDFAVEVTGQATQHVEQDQRDEIAGHLAIEGSEAAEWHAQSFTLRADKFTLLVNGQVAIQIDKSGAITLGAAGLSIDGSAITFKGSKIILASG